MKILGIDKNGKLSDYSDLTNVTRKNGDFNSSAKYEINRLLNKHRDGGAVVLTYRDDVSVFDRENQIRKMGA